MRYYGNAKHVVQHIRLLQPDGTLERHVPPHRVPDKMVAAARRGRELVVASKHLVAHAGVALYNDACLRVTPEHLCAALLRFEDLELLRQECRLVFTDATAAHVAATAALIQTNTLCAGRQLREVQLSMAVPLPGDAVAEPALGAALTALADALTHLRSGGQRVTLHLGVALRQRRCIELLVRALERSLLAATGMSQLTISASTGSSWRADDAARLVDAAKCGWRARELAVLHGTHAHGESHLRLLPAALVRTILDLAADGARPCVKVQGFGAVSGQGAAATSGAPTDASLPAPQAPVAPPPPMSHAGADLGFIASLV